MGIVVALEEESDALLTYLVTRTRGRLGGFPFWRGPVARRECALIRCGPGLVRAEKAARALVERLAPPMLISFGVAGGLVPDLALGDVVLVTRVCLTEEEEVIEADPRLARVAREVAEELIATAPEDRPMYRVREGSCTSRERLLVKIEEKAAAGRRSGATIVDMETLSVARVAREAGIPWIGVRGVSDLMTEDLPLDFNHYLGPDGQPRRFKIFLAGLMGRKLRELVALERKTRGAARNAASYVEAFLRGEQGELVPL